MKEFRMTVTVNKISKAKPPTNPLAFDPDTQPGELVVCIDGNTGLMRGEVCTFLERSRDGYLYVKDRYVWYNDDRFCNVHRLPDGTLAFGRGPAVTKPEKLYTTDEVRESPIGSLFENTNPHSTFTHARRIVGHVLLRFVNTDEHLLVPGGMSRTTWRFLSPEHDVVITCKEEA
jgi:hypothetical protein